MTDPILRIGESGLESSDARVKSLMNNMVNAQTPGFKKSDVAIRSFPLYLESAQSKLSPAEPKVEGAFYNHKPGSLIHTGNALDLALGGEGYFAVQTPWGEGYTRDGRFCLDAEGRLITAVGNYPLLGQQGPILVVPGSRVEFSSSGDVRVEDEVVDRVRVAVFENPKGLESVNNTLFRIPEGRDLRYKLSEAPRVVQGYTEASNVNVIEEMMDLIYLSRAYGVNTKLISARDAALTKALEMGKP